MFVCRLFHRSRPFEQVDARIVADGAVSIGRDPGADWSLDDPDKLLSRIHCTLSVDGGRLLLRDSSTNGTFLGNGERAPRDVPIPVEPRETLRLGDLTILVDLPPEAEPGETMDRTAIRLPIGSTPIDLPDALSGDDDTAPSGGTRATPLLQAFCEGAGLDVSHLSSEDPVELMRRLGGIYQQTVIGLAALVAERTRLKAENQIDRTTIGAIDNNPFKWARTRRLARELLGDRHDGFLTGADAVRASFEDLARHSAGTAAGADAAIRAILDALDPRAIEDDVAAQGFSLKGRGALSWEIHNRRYAALIDKDAGDSPPVRAFRDAYAAATATAVGDDAP
jgi:predicted component of type VI protein secretion system